MNILSFRQMQMISVLADLKRHVHGDYDHLCAYPRKLTANTTPREKEAIAVSCALLNTFSYTQVNA